MKFSLRPLARPLLWLAVCSVLGACSWLKRPAPYADSRGTGELQVPDRLDKPRSDPALSLPPSATGSGLLARDGQVPPEIGDPGVSTDAAEGASAASFTTSFQVEDEPASAYQRVGLALDRAGYTILARDSARAIYRVEVELPATERGRWWKFWQRARSERAELVVQVAATDSDRTEVSVLDGASQPIVSVESGELLAALKSRLDER